MYFIKRFIGNYSNNSAEMKVMHKSITEYIILNKMDDGNWQFKYKADELMHLKRKLYSSPFPKQSQFFQFHSCINLKSTVVRLYKVSGRST